MNIKLIMRAAFSHQAIYQLRKAPLLLTIIMSLFIGILHFTPFTLTFVSVEPYVRHIEQIWQLTTEEKRQLIQALPSECAVDGLQLHCDEVVISHVNDDLGVLVNNDDVEFKNGLIFMADHFIFVSHTEREIFSYHHLEGFNFQYLQHHPQGYEILMTNIAQALQGVLIFPFVFGSYLTGIVSFWGYIVIVSIFAMLLRFRHTSFLSYKEVLNIMIFSSVLPTMLVIIIGFITPAFTTLIFNLTTPVVAYFVYKNYVVPGLQNMSDETKEKDFKGVV